MTRFPGCMMEANALYLVFEHALLPKENFMKTTRYSSALAVFLILLWTGTMALSQHGQSLYQRLGGYDKIAAIAHDYFGRVRSDPQFSRFTGGRSQDSLKRARQLLVDQLCSLTGGPCVYIGRDMKTAHGGLGITSSDWEASMRHLAAALDQHKIPQKEKGEVLSIIAAYKEDIVEKGKP
jgi:hemoglobin